MNLSPIGWAIRPLKNYANFSGRAPRAEFWWFFLFAMILYVGFWIFALALVGGAMMSQAEPTSYSEGGSAMAMFGALGAVGLVMVLFWLVLLIPTIAVQARRLHDTGRSGWWLGAYYLLYLVYLALTFGAMPSAVQPGTPQGGSMGMMVAVLIVGLGFLVYSIVLLVFYCLPGTSGPNRYGPDPYGADVKQVFA